MHHRVLGTYHISRFPKHGAKNKIWYTSTTPQQALVGKAENMTLAEAILCFVLVSVLFLWLVRKCRDL